MRISDWSSDVCSSDLFGDPVGVARGPFGAFEDRIAVDVEPVEPLVEIHPEIGAPEHGRRAEPRRHGGFGVAIGFIVVRAAEQREGQGGEKENSPHDAMNARSRSEEHTSELQSLMRISYAVFCLKKKHQISALSNTLYHHIIALRHPSSV